MFEMQQNIVLVHRDRTVTPHTRTWPAYTDAP